LRQPRKAACRYRHSDRQGRVTLYAPGLRKSRFSDKPSRNLLVKCGSIEPMARLRRPHLERGISPPVDWGGGDQISSACRGIGRAQIDVGRYDHSDELTVPEVDRISDSGFLDKIRKVCADSYLYHLHCIRGLFGEPILQFPGLIKLGGGPGRLDIQETEPGSTGGRPSSADQGNKIPPGHGSFGECGAGPADRIQNWRSKVSTEYVIGMRGFGVLRPPIPAGLEYSFQVAYRVF